MILGITFLNKLKTEVRTFPGESSKFYINQQAIPLVREKRYNCLYVFTVTKEVVDCEEFVKCERHQILPPRSLDCAEISLPAIRRLLGNLV